MSQEEVQTEVNQVNQVIEPEEPVKETIIKPLDLGGEEVAPKKPRFNFNRKLVAGGFLIIFLGLLSGWGLSKLTHKGVKEEAVGDTMIETANGKVEKLEVGKVYGIEDGSFKDSAVGVIGSGGVNGEGTHRLNREGGESQTAYLTSSVLDLDSFVGHKVEVWGETFASQKAGWLLDVGRIKVLE
ncbi:hypothetical protein KKD61_05355 [Patescibacteria group bacterium]|nr:hypothetical protein [Patescibacteria group bacterium]